MIQSSDFYTGTRLSLNELREQIKGVNPASQRYLDLRSRIKHEEKVLHMYYIQQKEKQERMYD